MQSSILAKVIEYCKYHVAAAKTTEESPAKTEEEIKSWETEFVKVDQGTLFELILVRAAPLTTNHTQPAARLRSLPARAVDASSVPDCFCALQAANYLNIKNLLDLTCLTVANMIKGASNSSPDCSECL